jgi:protein O-mannosyl-transferase
MDSTRKNIITCLFLVLLTLGVHWGVLGNDFINYDDFQYVADNPHVLSGLTKANVIWAFTSGHAANWHPLTWLSHMMDVELFGLNPRGHHLSNLLFHCANTYLLFLVLNNLTAARWRNMFVALLFAVHPLHVESVAWVAERKDVLSTLFGMLSLLLYTRYVQKRSPFYYTALCICFALGLMAKPMLVTLPFVLLLLDYWPLQRLNIRQEEPANVPRIDCEKRTIGQLVIEKLPLFALTLLSSCVTLYVQTVGEAVNRLEDTPLLLRVSNVPLAYVRYLRKAVWPDDLSILYPLPNAISPLMSVGAGLVLLAITLAVVAQSRKRSYLLVGWLWFLGTLVPVIGIIQVGMQSMTDRYTYFPLIGIFIMAVWGGADLARRWPSLRKPLVATAAGLLVASSVVTWRYEKYWKNSTSLFAHAVVVTDDNYYAHYLLGNAMLKDDLLQDALARYEEVRKINPKFADVFVNMGIIHARQGDLPQAVSHFTSALMLKPRYKDAHFNLAVALQDQGKFEEAMAQYLEVLRIDPFDVLSHNNLGVALMRVGRLDEAATHFREALKVNPDYEQARGNLQLCLQHSGFDIEERKR